MSFLYTETQSGLANCCVIILHSMNRKHAKMFSQEHKTFGFIDKRKSSTVLIVL